MMDTVDYSKMRVLVTGGAGFIGSHIVEHLLGHGAEFVRVIDNLSSGLMVNIENFFENSNFEFWYGDISNYDKCLEACKGMNMVCHQAAMCSVPKSIDFPSKNHESNVNGFFNIIQAAKDTGIMRFVYATSSSVYGNDDAPVKVEDTIGNQISPYAASKYINEIYAKNYNLVYGMQTVGLRYFNVFGPRQHTNGSYSAVVPSFIESFINNKQPEIYGDGTFTRDFVYVKDVVRANILALTTDNELCFGNVFNVGSNKAHSVNDVFHTIRNLLPDREHITPVYKPFREGDVPHTNASTDKSEKVLGFKAIINFEDGMKDTISYFI